MVKRFSVVAFVFTLLAGLIMSPSGTAAQEQAASGSPASLANQLASGLTTAQRSLLLGNTPEAVQETAMATGAASALATRFTADPSASADLTTSLDQLTTAAAAGDQIAFAVARSTVWTAVLRGAMAESIAAAKAGDATSAGDWLLVREYRRTTKLSLPTTDATLAVQALQAGTMTPDDAATVIERDLLDTYQGLLDAALASAMTSAGNGYTITQASAAAEAAGFWAIIAPAFETQRDQASRQSADATFTALTASVANGDSAAFQTSADAAASIVAGFRAAPMSEEETASRAHQLLLYLNLVPVEYGRGVRGDQVSSDIEIIEAQAFLDAARSAFADLRPSLSEIDPATTETIAAALDQLNTQIQATGRKETVTPTDQIGSAIDQVENQLNALYPQAWKDAGGTADFEVIGSILDQMEAAVASGQYKQAESARLQAYAIYESGPEKHLLGFAPSVARDAETLFWQGNGSSKGLATAIQDHASSQEIASIRAELDQALADGQRRLGADRPGNGAVVFNAATIVFREGLEAVLILASLLASMIGANARFKRPLAFGAIAAFVATALLFVLARTVLMSLNQYGEKLEAIVSIVAIGVLLLVMNWFFHKVYWTKWIAHHHTRRRMLIGGAAGQMLGLVVLGFTSVFREGAETVLFLQALVLDAGTTVVIEGVALGLIATAVVGTLVFVMQAKLPHKKMLTVTGVMIALVLVMMVGNTIHVWQVVGWMEIYPIGDVVFPYQLGVWFGAYATWEGVIAQAAAVIFVIGSYFVAEWQHERSIKQRVAASEAAVGMPRLTESRSA